MLLSGLHGFLQRALTKAEADLRIGLAGNLAGGCDAARTDPYTQQDSVSELVRAVREVSIRSAILCLHPRPLPLLQQEDLKVHIDLNRHIKVDSFGLSNLDLELISFGVLPDDLLRHAIQCVLSYCGCHRQVGGFKGEGDPLVSPLPLHPLGLCSSSLVCRRCGERFSNLSRIWSSMSSYLGGPRMYAHCALGLILYAHCDSPLQVADVGQAVDDPAGSKPRVRVSFSLRLHARICPFLAGTPYGHDKVDGRLRWPCLGSRCLRHLVVRGRQGAPAHLYAGRM